MKSTLVKYCSAVAFIFSFSVHADYAMGALCLNPAYTEYVCCPYKGGWTLSSSCSGGAKSACEKDTGVVVETNISILADCMKRGGSKVTYPFEVLKYYSYILVKGFYF